MHYVHTAAYRAILINGKCHVRCVHMTHDYNVSHRSIYFFSSIISYNSQARTPARQHFMLQEHVHENSIEMP